MKDKNPLFINKKVWSQFTEQELESYVLSVFNHYRLQGFPYFETEQRYRDKEFDKMMKYDASKLYQNGCVKQTMHGLALAWSYFPHSFDVRCNNSMTPIECFNDDELLVKVIRKRIRMGDNMSDNGLRKMIKMFSGVQSVSNFRPTAAASIYSKFTNQGDTVYDMSCGFGGRLLGSIKAGVKYIGVDPSTKTYKGLIEMSQRYAPDAKIILSGSEEYLPKESSIDFAFTSPPYFDTEKYSNDDSQSYIKYKSKKEWLEGFLLQTLLNVNSALKDGKHMVINIANVKSYPDLEEDTLEVAKAAGFMLESKDRLLLSNSTFKKGKSAFKSEPLFVFKKKSQVCLLKENIK